MQIEHQGLTITLMRHMLCCMKQHGESLTIDQRIVQRRRRAFMAALTVQGETQITWAAKHDTTQSAVSKVLSGRIASARILGLIYLEIGRAAKVASKAMEIAL